MAEYYFDMETYSPGERPDPENDKIVSIQFQRMDLKTGKSIGKLEILKEWESSEKEIVTQFYNAFFKDGQSVWDFIAVGMNLNFEWEFLISKFDKYLGKKILSRDLHYNRPHIDIKSIIVLLNGGSFQGAKLDNFTKKPMDGRVIKDYYEKKDWEKIEDYIKTETESFLEFFQQIKSRIHLLVD